MRNFDSTSLYLSVDCRSDATLRRDNQNVPSVPQPAEHDSHQGEAPSGNQPVYLVIRCILRHGQEPHLVWVAPPHGHRLLLSVL